MKSDIQLYPDLIKALEKNEIVYLFGAGFSTALSGRKYTWWDWIVDGIGRIKDHATADMLNESLMSDNSTDNMVSVVGKVIKILKEEGSYKTWMHEAFESTVVVNEKLKNTLMKIRLIFLCEIFCPYLDIRGLCRTFHCYAVEPASSCYGCGYRPGEG